MGFPSDPEVHRGREGSGWGGVAGTGFGPGGVAGPGCTRPLDRGVAGGHVVPVPHDATDDEVVTAHRIGEVRAGGDASKVVVEDPTPIIQSGDRRRTGWAKRCNSQ